jgi:hypothetical protein
MPEEMNRIDTLNLMKEVISDKEARDFLLDICEFGEKIKIDGKENTERPKIFLLCDVQIDNYNAVCPVKSHHQDGECHKEKEKCEEKHEEKHPGSDLPCVGCKILLESIRCSELNLNNVQRFLLRNIIVYDCLKYTCLYIANPTKEDLMLLMNSKDDNLVVIAL